MRQRRTKYRVKVTSVGYVTHKKNNNNNKKREAALKNEVGGDEKRVFFFLFFFHLALKFLEGIILASPSCNWDDILALYYSCTGGVGLRDTKVLYRSIR